MAILADTVDIVIGVDPHKHNHTGPSSPPTPASTMAASRPPRTQMGSLNWSPSPMSIREPGAG